ncbi:hypothetical protein M440DRAFT_290294 [Trichoderma longibrachiatum ATCC 18648]|uniref:Uncharacterized protein n=1 Tax=Trichoderma longibrachiatum ATCC 18648 TaxID=983965 RepID=A0A2T4C874_TRILO|nr:hypothetical protein M440DRAFT_290294 [Trichoderma longibrachiatum ATCC 18648]
MALDSGDTGSPHDGMGAWELHFPAVCISFILSPCLTGERVCSFSFCCDFTITTARGGGGGGARDVYTSSGPRRDRLERHHLGRQTVFGNGSWIYYECCIGGHMEPQDNVQRRQFLSKKLGFGPKCFAYNMGCHLHLTRRQPRKSPFLACNSDKCPVFQVQDHSG